MNNLFKNSFLNLLSQASSFIFGFLISVILARYLGSANMGHFSFLMQLTLTLALIFTLGLPRVLTKFVAGYLQEGKLNLVKQLVSRILFTELKISLLVTLAALLLISKFLTGENTILYFLAILSVPMLILGSIINGTLQGLQKYGTILKVNFLTTFLNFILTIILVLNGKSLTELLTLNLFIQAVAFLISIFYVKNYLQWKIPKLEKSIFGDVSKYTMSTSLIVILDLILMERSEVFFLKIFSSVEQIAFYSLSFGLVSKLMILIPGAISGVMMPKIAGLHSSNDQKAISSAYFSTTKYLILITIPIVFGGLAIIDLFVPIVYGDEYLPLIPIIRILLISSGLSAIVAAASSVIYGIGKQNIILKIAIFAAAFNLILDLILIPALGAFGAALANGAAQLTGVIVGTYYMIFVKKMIFPWILTLKTIIAAFLALAAILILRSTLLLPQIVEFLVYGLIFLAIYVILIIFLKALKNYEK